MMIVVMPDAAVKPVGVGGGVRSGSVAVDAAPGIALPGVSDSEPPRAAERRSAMEAIPESTRSRSVMPRSSGSPLLPR